MMFSVAESQGMVSKKVGSAKQGPHFNRGSFTLSNIHTTLSKKNMSFENLVAFYWFVRDPCNELTESSARRPASRNWRQHPYRIGKGRKANKLESNKTKSDISMKRVLVRE